MTLEEWAFVSLEKSSFFFSSMILLTLSPAHIVSAFLR